jgi:hypothetical protein
VAPGYLVLRFIQPSIPTAEQNSQAAAGTGTTDAPISVQLRAVVEPTPTPQARFSPDVAFDMTANAELFPVPSDHVKLLLVATRASFLPGAAD